MSFARGLDKSKKEEDKIVKNGKESRVLMEMYWGRPKVLLGLHTSVACNCNREWHMRWIPPDPNTRLPAKTHLHLFAPFFSTNAY